jgi:tungstate transport system substrate-binding protein
MEKMTRKIKGKNRKPVSAFIVLAILAGLMAATVGCSSSATTSPPATTPAAAVTPAPKPANPELILATTTSTQDSGLLDVLVPMFEAQTGYNVKTVAVGTGAALAMGQRGEADVLLVHAPTSEIPLIESGDAINRRLIMHNDFVIVGPPSDPAGISGTSNAVAALAAIANSQSTFISRGDDSGTNKMELSLWKKAGIDPSGQSWYQETGQGMGASLTITSEKQGYTLTDRATYLATKANLSLDIFTQGDPLLLNIYHVMQVNPDKHDNINAEGAKAFVDFMVDPATQEVIKNFGVDKYGQPLFFPDADKTEADLGSV